MNDTVIVITKPTLGTTAPEDAAFGTEMLDKFLHTLESRPDKPRAICLYTAGVKAATRDSPLALALKLLEGLGVRVVLCQSCLKHYDLEDQVAVGEIGGMTDIVQLMEEATKVITV